MDERVEQNFSDARLNDVKERLKARQALRDRQATPVTAKLISLDEAVRLHNEDKKLAEVRFMVEFATTWRPGGCAFSPVILTK